MASISLISLNIERSKHIDLVLPFLRERNPDVVCLQELNEKDIPLFEQLFAERTDYVPFCLYEELSGETNPQGVCVFSRFPLTHTIARYYVGGPSEALGVVTARDTESFTQARRAVLCTSVEKEGESFRVCTTHFTWSEGGKKTELQKKHLVSLLQVLADEKEFVLCGDFNAPRGGEIFSELTSRYTDTIPPQYETSLDLNLHRAAREGRRHEIEKKMIDGLFSTPSYAVSDVALVDGVSDHCAIVAAISKG